MQRRGRGRRGGRRGSSASGASQSQAAAAAAAAGDGGASPGRVKGQRPPRRCGGRGEQSLRCPAERGLHSFPAPPLPTGRGPRNRPPLFLFPRGAGGAARRSTGPGPGRARRGPARTGALRERWRRLPRGGGCAERPCLSPFIGDGLGRVVRLSDPEDGSEGLCPPRPGAPPGAGGARCAAAFGQGASPAAVALGADLADGCGVVLTLVGQRVDVVHQLLHRARSEQAPRADGWGVGEAVHAVAVALDADVSILPAAGWQEEREQA